MVNCGGLMLLTMENICPQCQLTKHALGSNVAKRLYEALPALKESVDKCGKAKGELWVEIDKCG